ncbi:MAG TPA: DUF4342 domain-containing protein [Anaerolineae bacterium]|nr:DUF4342 domain-containing protein [Anaerolineae bacterium]
MSKEETQEIPIEEEQHEEEHVWTEEFQVAGSELWNTLMSLVDEANVRRVIIKDANGKTLASMPLWVGIGAVAIMQVYAAIALIGALMFSLSITVERAEKKPEAVEDIDVEVVGEGA